MKVLLLTFIEVLLVLAKHIADDLVQQGPSPALCSLFIVLLLLVFVDFFKLKLLECLNLALQLFAFLPERPFLFLAFRSFTFLAEV